MIWPILEARAEIEKYFCSFFVQMKTSKSAFEINWPIIGINRLKLKGLMFSPLSKKSNLLGIKIGDLIAPNLCLIYCRTLMFTV